MTSIHDDGRGSRSDEVSLRFQRLHQEQEDPAARPEELEAVLAVSHTGWCRLDARLALLSACPLLKAELGCPPDAQPEWEEVRSRMAAEDRGRLDDAVRAAFQEGREVALTAHLLPPGRPPQHTLLRGRITRASGEPVLLLTFRVLSEGQDETAALLAQERAAREAAEAALRAAGRFLSVISHELRSPLMSVHNWSEILARKHRDNEEVARIAGHIGQSAKTQMKIVSDLQDLARLHGGGLPMEPRPMQLVHVVRLALQLQRPAVEEKGLELIPRLEATPGALHGDPARLQQVVTELLANAIRFTPSPGRITVTLREEGTDIELSIEDTGEGIEPSLLPHVFDRYLQADSPGTRRRPGLGVGLTLVREIVTRHGGRVEARSGGPGTGAAFVVRLPASPAQGD